MKKWIVEIVSAKFLENNLNKLSSNGYSIRRIIKERSSSYTIIAKKEEE